MHRENTKPTNPKQPYKHRGDRLLLLQKSITEKISKTNDGSSPKLPDDLKEKMKRFNRLRGLLESKLQRAETLNKDDLLIKHYLRQIYDVDMIRKNLLQRGEKWDRR